MPFFHVRVIRNNKMKKNFDWKVPLGVSFFLLQDFLRFLTIFFASSMVIFFCVRKRKLRAHVHARSNGSYLWIQTIDRSNSRSLCPRSPAERAPTWPPERRRIPSFSLVFPTCFLPVVARWGTPASRSLEPGWNRGMCRLLSLLFSTDQTRGHRASPFIVGVRWPAVGGRKKLLRFVGVARGLTRDYRLG